MLVKFTFTDSPPGPGPIHILTGVVYKIHDSEGNQIIYNEVGIEDLQPGQYCIYATKWAPPEGSGNIYFGELAFEVPEVAPPKPPIIPPPFWDVWVTVYMEIIPIEEKEEVPCPEMYPQEDGSLLWLGILILLLMGAG